MVEDESVSDFRFGDVVMLHGLWLLPVLLALMLYAARRRKEALRRFVEAGPCWRGPAAPHWQIRRDACSRLPCC